ncbi:MAG: hypothetical protein R2762_04335 [Bryobacteraceae bacterium]
MKKNLSRILASAQVLALLCLACSSSAAAGEIKGTYENAQANVSIEFLGDGKAFVSIHGLGGEAKYKVAGSKITLDVDGEITVFTVNSDGSLSGPPESFFARLKKKK